MRKIFVLLAAGTALIGCSERFSDLQNPSQVNKKQRSIFATGLPQKQRFLY
jgi:hypothetical protein